MGDEASGDSTSLAMPLLLIVAPATGKLHVMPPQTFKDGREWVEPGQVVAQIDVGDEHIDAKAARRGYLGGMMGRDGEPVRQGQPIAWMEALPEAHIRPVEDTA